MIVTSKSSDLTSFPETGRGDLAFIVPNTGQHYSWSAWQKIIETLAQDLLRRGIKGGDLIVHQGTNHPLIWSLAMACWRLGADFWPMNYRWAPEEISRGLGQMPNLPTLHVVEDPYTAKVRAAYKELDRGPVPIIERDTLWATSLSGPRGTLEVPNSPPGRLIMATGGTTGATRLVGLEQTHLEANARMFREMTDLRPEDVILVCAPNFHVAGFSALTLAGIQTGSTLVFAPRFEPAEILEAVAKYKVTATVMVPTMWRAIFAQARTHSLAPGSLMGLRFGICGGAPMDPPLLDEARDRGFELLQGYGMTEAGPMVTLMPPGAMEEGGAQRATSAGIAPPGIEVRIVDETGLDLPPGQAGQIVIKGPNLVGAYLNPETPATRTSSSTFKQGYYYSGDRGHLDDEGFLHVHGRLDEMIISGGENVAPAEVEAALRRVEGIEDIAVLGVPDPYWGERIVAIVVPRSMDELPQWTAVCETVKGALARYKMPKELRFTHALPTSGAEKVLRPRLLELWYELSPSA